MKKSTFILAAAAVSFALVGCEKKSSVEQQSSGELIEKTFYANQGGKQKTTLDPATLATLWSEGDAIKVYSEAGGAGNDFTIESGVGESAATFTGLTTPSDFYVAFYPAENAKSISEYTVTFNMPDTQTVTEAGSFDTNTVPMVGYTTDESLAMMNVGSLFELGLKAKEGTPKVVKIELVGNNGEKLAGNFTVEASVSGQPTAAYSANGATTLTINCGEYSSSKYQGIALNASEFTYFYISIPAGVFTKGFTAVLTSADGNEAEVTTTADIHKGAATLTEFEADGVEFEDPLPRDMCDNRYHIVNLGTQVWLKENMRCNKYDTNSEAYKAGITTIYTSSGDVFNPCYADPTTADRPDYMTVEQFGKLGLLYNWAAAMGYKDKEEAQAQSGNYSGKRQGVCLNGWHIPSASEWTVLVEQTFGDKDEAKKMKTSTGWQSGIGLGDDGFASLPAGAAYSGSVSGVGIYTYYWLADANGESKARNRYLAHDYNYVYNYSYEKSNVYSVRCIKD